MYVHDLTKKENTNMHIEKRIIERSIELGFEKCGIVRIEDLKGYDERLQERIDKIPMTGHFYQSQKRLTNLTEQYPWAKSVVVVASNYGHYKVPTELKNHIAKHYLFDGRVMEESEEFKRSVAMEEFLKEMGLQTVSERKFGVVGLRWAAMKAGLGMVRKNNFFYTESGSWIELEAWITDREMEFIESTELPECPKGCTNCMKACTTCSLSEPYTMNPFSCISFLTTFGGRDLPKEPLRDKFEGWIYGCDACQNACPMNKDKWIEADNFPGLQEIAQSLSPEGILSMAEAYYRTEIQPRFFYLKAEELWKWKVNTLNFMLNHYKDEYKPYLLDACNSEHEKIREFAQMICTIRSLHDNI